MCLFFCVVRLQTFYFHRSSMLGGQLKALSLSKPQAVQLLNPTWRAAASAALLRHARSAQGFGAGVDGGLGGGFGLDSGAVSDSSAGLGLGLLRSLGADGDDDGAAAAAAAYYGKWVRQRNASAKAAAAAAADDAAAGAHAAIQQGRQQHQQQQHGRKPPLKPGKKQSGKGAAGARGAAAQRGGLGVYYHSQGANALGRAELSAAGDDEVDEDYQRVSQTICFYYYGICSLHSEVAYTQEQQKACPIPAAVCVSTCVPPTTRQVPLEEAPLMHSFTHCCMRHADVLVAFVHDHHAALKP
jgi:hypothetical protein